MLFPDDLLTSRHTEKQMFVHIRVRIYQCTQMPYPTKPTEAPLLYFSDLETLEPSLAWFDSVFYM